MTRWLALLIFTLAAPGFAQLPQKACDEFTSQFKACYEKRDIEGLLDLYCWDGIRIEERDSMKSMYERGQVKKLDIARIRPLSDEEKKILKSLGHDMNLPVVGMVEFRLATGCLLQKTYVGRKEGKLYLVMPLPTTVTQ